MNSVELPRFNNRHVLIKLAEIDHRISAVKAQLKASQCAYFFCDRNPLALRPLGLHTDIADWLRERYSAERVGDKLRWIKSLREEHDLDCCPMCGGTGVAELDHVLPKADYPEFATFSFNLVPTCSGCNKRRSNKGNRYHFVHPYFDTELLNRLELTVTFRQPYDLVRMSLTPTGVAGNDLIRVQKQIEETLPILQFRRRVRKCWRDWQGRFVRLGKSEAVARLLDELKYAEASSRNSWEVAFMRGLSLDESAQNWMATTSIPTTPALPVPIEAVVLLDSHVNI